MKRMALALFCTLIFLLSSQLVVTRSYAEGGAKLNLRDFDYGIRIAGSFRDGKSGLTLYELFAAIPLPWGTDFANSWRLSTAFDLSLGLLEGKGESGGRAAAGVDAFLWSPGRKLAFTSGLGVGVMGEEVYGDIDFAGPVFFRFQAGLGYWLTSALSIGGRYYHESNGSIYDKNPSLNAYLGELRFNF